MSKKSNQVKFSELTVEELEERLKSEDDISVQQLEALLKEHRRRVDTLNEAWTLEEAREFLRSNVIPETTPQGVWIKDVKRNRSEASMWSDAELLAFLNKEIEAYGRASEDSLLHEIKRRGLKAEPIAVKVTPAVTDADSVPTATLATTVVQGKEPKVVEVKPQAVQPETLKKGLTLMNQQFITQILEDYVTNLRPGRPVSIKEGLQYQQSLDKLFRYVIGLQDPVGFKSGMDLIFAMVCKHREKGVFEDTYAFRFTDQLTVQSNVQESHIQLLTLLLIFADKDKAAREQYDLQMLVQLFPIDRQPLLLQYFSQLD